MPAKTLGVIPARYASQRAPGKPLTDLAGKTMIRRVWEQSARAGRVARLIVATEDRRIFDEVESFGGTAMMTGSEHPTGSDRVAEVLRRLREAGEDYDLVVNVQGDMPFINPDVIDGTIRVLDESPLQFGISTVAVPILSEEEYMRPSAVKAVLGTGNEALYFSRSPMPFIRNRDTAIITESEPYGYKHMGLYVYRPDVLERISTLPQSLPEKREQLEQLRALCNGIGIKVFVASPEMVQPGIEVDTPEDIERAVAYIKSTGKNC